jgi:CBS domain containing-hemolysin-like protein
MHRHRVNAVLVTSRDGEPLGWVTSRGLLSWLQSSDLGLAHARQAISEPALTINSSATARDALAALAQSTCTHLLVTRSPDGGVEGVLSALDLVGHFG